MQNPSPLIPPPSPSPSSPQPWLSPSQLLFAHSALFMLEQQALHRYINHISGSAVSPRVWTDADCLHAQLGTAGTVINSISSLHGKDRTFPSKSIPLLPGLTGRSLKCHRTFAAESTSGGFLWVQGLIQAENGTSLLNLSSQSNSFCLSSSF